MTEEEGDRKRLLVYSALAVIMTGAALSHGLLFGRNELAMDVLIPLSYLGLGMMIKYGDQAYDAGAYPKRTALLLSLPGGVWLGSLMAVDPGSATIFLGLLIGLLLAGKLDNLAFGIGAVTAVAIMVLALLAGVSSFSLIGSLVVLVFAFIDEKTNDLPWVDEERTFKAVVLHNRPFLKVAILALCLAGILPSILYFFAFMAFDLAYSVVEVLSLRRGVPSVG